MLARVVRKSRSLSVLGISLALLVATPSSLLAQKRGDKDEKDRPSKDDPWELPPGTYWEDLEAVDSKDQISGGVRVRVVCIPNSLYYFMSRECVELEKAGYDDKALGKKLQSVYRKYKSQKNRMLFLVSIGGSDASTKAFYVSKPTRHIEMKVKKKKASLHFVEEERKPRFKVWETYQYVPNAPRKVIKKKLAEANKHYLAISSRGIKTTVKDPITLSVSGLFHAKTVKGRGGDEGLGVNSRFNQISMYRWRDQIMKPLSIRIYPGRWEVPEPPQELVDLVKRLSG